MPRLIPRLLKALSRIPENSRDTNTYIPAAPPRRRTIRPRHVPTLNVPSHLGRQRSVLLDEVNPITNSDAFRKKMSPQPLVRPVSAVPSVTEAQEDDGEIDVDELVNERRIMTAEERGWWANPYLRMLASPMRQCIVTDLVQPADFMVRLAPMHVPVDRTGEKLTTFFPDGMEHPRYRGKRAGSACYVLCYKDAVEHIVQSRPHQKKFLDNVLPPGSLLTEHVGHVLRVRVIQELELLGERLRCRPVLSREIPVLRRLLRTELQQIKNEGVIPQEGAVAVLIVPPPNKDPSSKRRPEPSMSAPPNVPDDTKTRKYPVSELYSVKNGQADTNTTNSLISTSSAKVPLYHGASLFPLPAQRAAFYRALKDVVHIEARARSSQFRPDNDGNRFKSHKPLDLEERKNSHAYVLYSTAQSLERADSVPLAIALWRLRMWEGGGWDDDHNSTGIYMRNPPWFDRNAEQ
ncbi:hypothetical protein BDY19DRAFT_925171 [Irpex rosettiformis]|uniref:Uncharacterized protein n=1 Tax=Irpex rosettiformis TaxID=378272 RepID=A0ACB8UDZ4_9APHY|nr:hypothetical protein BDY19DRAFT_925171 [Irpex rosettiformis]